MRGVAPEADSFAFHGSRTALERGCRRYDELVRTGWLVPRFSWEQVVDAGGWVGDTVEETLAHRPPVRPRRRRGLGQPPAGH